MSTSNQTDRVARALPDVTVELVDGLPAQELERACCRAQRLGDVGQRAIAFYLEQMHATGLHQQLGFSSVAHFAAMRLGMAPRTARELVATGRALRELECVDRAFASGELCWTKVRLLARVATPETERAWIERAREIPSEELEREVKGSEKGRLPREDRKGLPEVRYTVRVQVDAVTRELWEQALRLLSTESGVEVSEPEALRSLAEHLLRGGESGAAHAAHASLFHLVVDRCPDCRQTSLRTDAGSEPLTPAQAESVSCEALPFGSDRKTAASLRRQVLKRDGFRCRCCGGRLGLMAHHVVFRSEGGPTIMANLVTLCTRCHALVHDGKLRITGRAPHGLRMTSADGRPLGDLRAEGTTSTRRVRAADLPRVAEAPRAERVTFAGLPASVGAAWWREHHHLLQWHERRGTLTFTDGERRPGSGDESGAESPGPARERPTRFADIIGQRRATRSLELAVQAARTRRAPTDHVLLHGPPGLGKTTLARAVATEMGARLHGTSAPLLTDIGQLVGLLASARNGDAILIDEIHALPRKLCEVLYEAMEDGFLSLALAQGSETRTLRVELPRLTVIGATTDPDLLPRPLMDRFGLIEELLTYDHHDLAEIARQAARRVDVDLDDAGAHAIARAAQGTPRIALRLVARLRDFLAARPRRQVGREEVQAVLELLGLDADGLGPRHRETLELVRRHGRVGRSRLAGLLRVNSRTVRELIEPPLLALGLLRPTPRGLAVA